MTLARQFRQRMAHRAPGYASNAAMLADHGKYRRTEERDDEMNDDQKLLAEQQLAEILRENKNNSVLIAGGPNGSYHRSLYRDNRLEFLVSTEAEKKQLGYTIPAHTRAVIISKYLTFDLQRSIQQQARDRGIPWFGVVNSFGAVNRLVFGALNRLNEPEVEQTQMARGIIAARESMEARRQAAIKIVKTEDPVTPSAQTVTPSAVTLTTTPAASAPVSPDILAAFAEVETAIGLLRDAVLAAAAESEANRRDAQKLRALQDIMGQK